MSEKIYFSLAEHTYAVKFEDSVIILDVVQNQYVSLIDTAACFFTSILDESFTYDKTKNIYYPNTAHEVAECNEWIALFLQNNYLILVDSVLKKRAYHVAEQPDLRSIEWSNKLSFESFSDVSLREIFKAYLLLFKVNWQLKRSGIKGILNQINTLPVALNRYVPHSNEIHRLENALNIASWLYPQKIVCLPWAATFTLLARKKEWNCKLVIGVRELPFYAHAWAELDGNIIKDDPIIACILSVILKTQ